MSAVAFAYAIFPDTPQLVLLLTRFHLWIPEPRGARLMMKEGIAAYGQDLAQAVQEWVSERPGTELTAVVDAAMFPTAADTCEPGAIFRLMVDAWLVDVSPKVEAILRDMIVSAPTTPVRRGRGRPANSAKIIDRAKELQADGKRPKEIARVLRNEKLAVDATEGAVRIMLARAQRKKVNNNRA
jgi:hypothetical protein